MDWSPKQQEALKHVSDWFSSGNFSNKPYIYIGGWAGTGKSTLAQHFASGLSRVAYATFTGKAALVLKRKGCHGAKTIHSLIYKPVDEGSTLADENRSGKHRAEGPVFELDPASELRNMQLLILDECSMVNEQIRDDLLSFGVPIIVLGDPGQLPPVKGTGAFTGQRPDIMLDEVHRQALESPIIRIATDIRRGKSLARFKDDKVDIYPAGSRDIVQISQQYEQLLCGRNNVRISSNSKLRISLGYSGVYPTVGDKLICLRNNRREGIFNGLLVRVTEVHEIDDYRVAISTIDEDGTNRRLDIHELCFSDPEALDDLPWRERQQLQEFTYGYAITVHKSQGSQWDSVAVLDDGMFSWDASNRKKWLYTAVTRAVDKLAVIRWKADGK